MNRPRTHGDPRPTVAAGILIAMLAMAAIPASIALHSIVTPASVHAEPGASPHGYTRSLLLFIVPLAVIGGWLLPSEGLDIPRRAFGWTIGITATIGCLLDMVFARKLVPRTCGVAEARFLIVVGFTDQ